VSDAPPEPRSGSRWRDKGAPVVLTGIAFGILMLITSKQSGPPRLVCEIVSASVQRGKSSLEGSTAADDVADIGIHVACSGLGAEDSVSGQLRIGSPQMGRVVSSNGFGRDSSLALQSTAIDSRWSGTVRWSFHSLAVNSNLTLDGIGEALDSTQPVAVRFAAWNGTEYTALSDWLDLDPWRASLAKELRRRW